MPTFRGEFDVRGDVVLTGSASELSFETSAGYVVRLRNAAPDSEGHVPALVAIIVGAVASLDEAFGELRGVLAEQLDLFPSRRTPGSRLPAQGG